MSGEPNICLVCGRPAPCMTDDEGLANDGPGSPCTFEFPLSPPPMTGLPVEVDQLRDKIEGLEADLFLAVSTAYNRGAVDWTRLNYPEWFERLKVNAPALLAQPVLGEGEAREPVKMLVDADWLRRKVEADPEAEVEVRPGQGGMVKALADALDALLHEDSEKSEQDRLLTRLKARVQLEAAWDLLAASPPPLGLGDAKDFSSLRASPCAPGIEPEQSSDTGEGS